MAQEIVITPVGLFTDPNPLSAAPPGAMTEALNVVIQRPSVIEPRPGLQSLGAPYTSLPDGLVIKGMAWNEGGVVFLAYDLVNTRYTLYYGITEILQGGSYVGTAYWGSSSTRAPRILTYGQNFYIVADEGVMRLASDGTTAYRAGMPRPAQCQVTQSTTGGNNYPLTAATSIAYRICNTRTSGGVTFRSPPSARIVSRSYTASSPKRATLTFANTSSDVTEVYRSNALTTAYTDEPTDEMIMVGTAAANAATFVDDASFTGLTGPSLYTNATQGGALLENGITPLCRDIAIFRDMMFFADARFAPSLTFEVLGFGADWRGTNASTADRLTSLTITGTPAGIGSGTVNTVSAADIAKVRAGMRVYLDTSNPTIADAVFPIACYVQTVDTGAGSFTVSPVLLSAPGASTIRLSDWIEVSVVDGDGTTTERVFCDDASGTNYIDSREFQASTSADIRGPQQMAYELSDELNGKVTVSAFGDGVTDAWTFSVESYGSDVTSITVKTSNADAISSRIDGTTGKTVSTSDAKSGVLMWSKPGEVEHVPPGYNTRICESHLERIVPARDSILAFSSRDGVYRVSGYSPDALQVDEFDRTMRILHANMACECSGRVAAWTNKGLVLISESGTSDIGAPIADVLDTAAPFVDGHDTGLGLFMTWWADRSMLLVGVPTSASTYASHVYVWHERTQVWTRWTSERSITCCAPWEDTIYFGTAPATAFADTLILGSVDDSYDRAYAITIVSATGGGTIITIGAGSGWSPAVGDAVLQSGSYYVVTAVTSTTVFTVHAADLVAGAASALTREDSVIEWAVRDADNPGAQKMFREATFLFGSASGIADITSSYVTDRSRTAATSTASLACTTSDVPETVRTRIPREAKRCGRLEHTLTIPAAVPSWEFQGASYVYEPISTRFVDG
jgi:hypothetical protein